MNKSLKVMILFLVLTILVFSPQIMAEEVETEGELERIPLEDFQMPTMSRGFKGNGGPQITYLHLDLSNLNSLLENEDFSPLKEDMILFGGGGIGGFKLGSRVGGYGVQGELSSTNDDNRNKAILELDYGGFLYEHGVYAEKNTDIAWGFLLGGGSAEFIRIYNQTPAEGEASATHLKKEFVTLKPKLSINHKFAPFVGINFSAGYLLTYGNDWDHYGQTIEAPDTKFMGPSANLKISFGF